MSLIQQIFRVSDQVADDRGEFRVLAHVMEEVGELSQEVIIAAGHSYKEPGEDGVVGEAVDAILCVVDLIRIHNPNITEEQINKIAEQKLAKWLRNVK
jgi:hypothetical protein